jgi:hypothetical protein
MKKIVFPFLIFLMSSLNGSALYNFKNDKIGQHKFLYPKDFTPQSFITLFTKQYNKNKTLNNITMAGEFPNNWVKPKDVGYLISIMRSKQKCCNYMNVFSSHILNEKSEVGGFAIIFLNSYISGNRINLGLNCSPKTNLKEIQKIENWYNNVNHKN